MIHAAISAIILLGIYQFMNAKAENKINVGIAFVFVLVPSFVIFLIRLVLELYGAPQNYALFGYVLYFIFPFLFLKFALEYQNSSAFRYAIIVPAVATVTVIPFMFFMPYLE